MKNRKLGYIISAVLIVAIIFGVWFFNYNKIVGTVKGPEMNEIVLGDVTYVWLTSGECPYNPQKNSHIGKGAWGDGTIALDLYILKGDEDFNYLLARSGHEGQMYIRESILE